MPDVICPSCKLSPLIYYKAQVVFTPFLAATESESGIFPGDHLDSLPDLDADLGECPAWEELEKHDYLFCRVCERQVSEREVEGEER